MKTLLRAITSSALILILIAILWIPFTMNKIHNDNEDEGFSKSDLMFVDMELDTYLTAPPEQGDEYEISYFYKDYNVGNAIYTQINSPHQSNGVINIKFNEDGTLINTEAILSPEKWLSDFHYDGIVNDKSSFYILPIGIE